jgi:hypothetical protein
MIAEDTQRPILEIPTIGKNNMEDARAPSEKEASLAPLCAVLRTKVLLQSIPPYIYYRLNFFRELFAAECKRK